MTIEKIYRCDKFVYVAKDIWNYITMVSCQKGPTRHAYAWQIGPFWQDTLDISLGPITI